MSDFAADAYRACLYGHADSQQQQSVASALILANAAAADLYEALDALLRAMRRGNDYDVVGHHPVDGHPLNALGLAALGAEAALAKARRAKVPPRSEPRQNRHKGSYEPSAPVAPSC